MLSMLFFFVSCVLHSALLIKTDGFVAGTLIKTTPTTYVPIEQLAINDTLVASQNNQHCPIVRATKKTADHYVKIAIDDTYICAAYEQKFYVPAEDAWIKACDLTAGMMLATLQADVRVDSLSIVEEQIDIYTLTVAPPHTFSVSEYEIVAHNFIPFIGLAFVVA